MGTHNIPDKLEDAQCIFSASGRAWQVDGVGFMIAWGTSVPTGAGYGIGCTFMHTSAGTVYTNTGTNLVASFAISTAAVGQAELDLVSAAVVSEAAMLLTEKSTVNDVSEAVVSVEAVLLLTESEVSAAESDLLVEKSTVASIATVLNTVSEALSATESHLLINDSEVSVLIVSAGKVESELLV